LATSDSTPPKNSRRSTKSGHSTQKIVFKQRNGSKVTKRYDVATTPYARATARASVDGASRRAMLKVMDAVRPGDLYRKIQVLTTQLERVALVKVPAAVKPRVNRAFNQ